MAFKVVLDANVLYPYSLRDTLRRSRGGAHLAVLPLNAP